LIAARIIPPWVGMFEWLRIGFAGVGFHVVRDAAGLYLIDAGFIGGRLALARALRRQGWERERIVGIVVSHGHLDHILHVGRLAAETGAWVAAPRADARHYAGAPAYRGPSRVTGWLEALGRPLLGFRPFSPDRWLDDGDILEIGGGLEVVGLPGHTAGHCGFLSRGRRLLFCGDLLASFASGSHLPPPIFNSDGRRIRASVARVLAMDLEGILPCHGDAASPPVHLQRLRRLAAKWDAAAPG
jgi:glyoxylase-like metal-dependent hydrolase (beta-lactamase superfamily II)